MAQMGPEDMSVMNVSRSNEFRLNEHTLDQASEERLASKVLV